MVGVVGVGVVVVVGVEDVVEVVGVLWKVILFRIFMRWVWRMVFFFLVVFLNVLCFRMCL